MQWYILAGENEKVQVEFTDFVTEKCCDRVFVKDGTYVVIYKEYLLFSVVV
jgi:hypothetical protein